MMRRVMIQADEWLIVRARRVAAERGVTFPELVRQALARELGSVPVEPPTCGGVFDSGGATRERVYEPDPWR